MSVYKDFVEACVIVENEGISKAFDTVQRVCLAECAEYLQCIADGDTVQAFEERADVVFALKLLKQVSKKTKGDITLRKAFVKNIEAILEDADYNIQVRHFEVNYESYLDTVEKKNAEKFAEKEEVFDSLTHYEGAGFSVAMYPLNDGRYFLVSTEDKVKNGLRLPKGKILKIA
jgi:hypothetical protein